LLETIENFKCSPVYRQAGGCGAFGYGQCQHTRYYDNISVMGLTANITLMMSVMFPSVAVVYFLFNCCDTNSFDSSNSGSALKEPIDLCNLYLNHPIIFLNLLFFVNVSVLFWVISIHQKSTWLIGAIA